MSELCLINIEAYEPEIILSKRILFMDKVYGEPEGCLLCYPDLVLCRGLAGFRLIRIIIRVY